MLTKAVWDDKCSFDLLKNADIGLLLLLLILPPVAALLHLGGSIGRLLLPEHRFR